MGAAQCIALGAGILGLGVLLSAGLPVPVALAPPAVATVLAFTTWRGRPVHEQVPAVVSHALQVVLRRHRWVATIPLLTGTESDAGRRLSLPPFLDGLDLLDAGPLSWSASSAGLGVVRDRRTGDLSATLAVHGGAFAVLEREDQDRSLSRWGDVLAAFCGERRPISRIRVTEHAAPSGVAAHELFASDHGADPRTSAPRRAYDELLGTAAPAAVAHRVLVTLTVEQRRVRSRHRPALEAALDVLGEELRLLTARLDAAGLNAEPPMSTRELADALRRRLDPVRRSSATAGANSLAGLAGLDVTRRFGPMATESRWAEVRVDGSFHRTYWVAEWPRLEVGPSWLEPLLLHPGGVRTFSIHYEPVPPTRSQRRIDRDTTRLAADEEQRARAGFRIGARHRRAEAAVLEREHELVAGYAELEFAGFLTVSAANPEQLDRLCAEYEQAAGQTGLHLRALDARHDLGLVCSLPVARGLARRWAG
jgi:hypothetical protein